MKLKPVIFLYAIITVLCSNVTRSLSSSDNSTTLLLVPLLIILT